MTRGLQAPSNKPEGRGIELLKRYEPDDSLILHSFVEIFHGLMGNFLCASGFQRQIASGFSPRQFLMGQLFEIFRIKPAINPKYFPK